MKRSWIIVLVVVVLVYVFGMFYYDNRIKSGFSPKDSCSCMYDVGDFFDDGIKVIQIREDACSSTDVCSNGYCVIEYGYPESDQRFTYTAHCK